MNKTQEEITSEIETLHGLRLSAPQFKARIDAACDALTNNYTVADINARYPRDDAGDHCTAAALQATEWKAGNESEAFSVSLANELNR